MAKKPTDVLFPDENVSDVEKEWVGMPEFVQLDRKVHQEIIVRFANAEDVQKFAKLISRKITPLTTSLWMSKISFIGHDSTGKYREYKDEP